MNFLRYGFAAFAAILTAYNPVTASAAVLEYKFKASIVSMFESSAESGITNVSSSAFAGDLISIGDGVTGSFSYNTDGVLSPYYQPMQPPTGSYLIYIMEAGRSGLSFSVDDSSVNFRSALLDGMLILGNDNSDLSGSDTFNINFTGEANPVMFRLAGVSFYDFTGNAFSSGAIPEYLDFTSFTVKGLGAGWLRQSDGKQMQFQANITSIEVTESTVVLPSTFLLLASGLGLFFRFGSFRVNH